MRSGLYYRKIGVRNEQESREIGLEWILKIVVVKAKEVEMDLRVI